MSKLEEVAIFYLTSIMLTFFTNYSLQVIPASLCRSFDISTFCGVSMYLYFFEHPLFQPKNSNIRIQIGCHFNVLWFCQWCSAINNVNILFKRFEVGWLSLLKTTHFKINFCCPPGMLIEVLVWYCLKSSWIFAE